MGGDDIASDALRLASGTGRRRKRSSSYEMSIAATGAIDGSQKGGWALISPAGCRR
jgi:hypothetical protein